MAISINGRGYRVKRIALGLGVGILTLAGASFAATSQQFLVKLTINKSCTIDKPADVDFSSATFLTNVVDATTSVTVNCTKGTTAHIWLSGTPGSRKMTNTSNADVVNYDLWQDLNHSVSWDASDAGSPSVTGAGVDSSGATLDSTTTSVTVYGEVPVQSTPSTGTYQDTVTATVSF